MKDFTLIIFVSLYSFLLQQSFSFTNSIVRNSRYNSLSMMADSIVSQTILSATEETSLKIVSFNILAPCYNKLKCEGMESQIESEHREVYMARNKAICEQLLQSDADVICLQEFWFGSEDIRQLYTSMLCGAKGAGYSLKELRRTSHWRMRDDGLAAFVKDDRVVVQDTRAILFHDCGDRVAQMLLLALRPPAGAPANTPAQQFVCVNTHLLFPHNEYSTKIRLREIAKILGFIESYRMRELCSSVCGRSDVRLPIIIAGDFNGSPRGAVYKFARAQNYFSAFEEYYKQIESTENKVNRLLANDLAISNDKSSGEQNKNGINTENDADPHDAIRFDIPSLELVSKDELIGSDMNERLVGKDLECEDLEDLEPEHELGSTVLGSRPTWISHRSHRQENVPVDHIFFLNPTEQLANRLPPIPDWTNLVYREIFLKMTESKEIRTIQDIFENFDTANKSFITLEEFKTALITLGFVGEGGSALTEEEIKVLVSCADKDGNGMIDYKEFCDRFWLAANDKEQQQLYSYRFGKKSNFARSVWLSSDLDSDRVAEKIEEVEAEGGNGMIEDNGALQSISTPTANFFPSSIPVQPHTTKNSDKFTSTLIEQKTQPLTPVRPGQPFSATSLSSQFSSAKISLSTRYMADLGVSSVQLLPKELEIGIWPSDYTLSDHGMVEVVFKVAALPQEIIVNSKQLEDMTLVDSQNN